MYIAQVAAATASIGTCKPGTCPETAITCCHSPSRSPSEASSRACHSRSCSLQRCGPALLRRPSLERAFEASVRSKSQCLNSLSMPLCTRNHCSSVILMLPCAPNHTKKMHSVKCHSDTKLAQIDLGRALTQLPRSVPRSFLALIEVRQS